MDSVYKFKDKPFEELSVAELRKIHKASNKLINKLLDNSQAVLERSEKSEVAEPNNQLEK